MRYFLKPRVLVCKNGILQLKDMCRKHFISKKISNRTEWIRRYLYNVLNFKNCVLPSNAGFCQEIPYSRSSWQHGNTAVLQQQQQIRKSFSVMCTCIYLWGPLTSLCPVVLWSRYILTWLQFLLCSPHFFALKKKFWQSSLPNLFTERYIL